MVHFLKGGLWLFILWTSICSDLVALYRTRAQLVAMGMQRDLWLPTLRSISAASALSDQE